MSERVIHHRSDVCRYFFDTEFIEDGRTIDLPRGLPMFCMDIKQLSVMVGSPKHPPMTGIAHNALEDARWNRDLYNFLCAVPA